MGVRYFLVIMVDLAIAALRLVLRDGEAIDLASDDLASDPEQSAIRRRVVWYTVPTVLSVLILLAFQYGPTSPFGYRFEKVIQLLIAGVGFGDLLAPPFLWAFTYQHARDASPATLVLMFVVNLIVLIPVAAVGLFFYGISRIH